MSFSTYKSFSAKIDLDYYNLRDHKDIKYEEVLVKEPEKIFLKLAYFLLRTDAGVPIYHMKIMEQKFRLALFAIDSSTFKHPISNLALSSMNYPQLESSAKTLYVRGNNPKEDDTVIEIRGVTLMDNIKNIVRAYNLHMSERMP